MDIGTAKPALQERTEIPHHLIDILEPEDEFSVAQYVEHARKIARKIQARNKRVLFVGGTPLYLKGLLRGIFDGPPANAEIREKLTQFAESGGDLHAKLAAIDVISAKRLHPNDIRRIVRALEVYKLTGQPISALQTQFDVPASRSEHIVWTLDWDKDELNNRINCRVVKMFDEGFFEEACQLYQRPLSKTASQAVGYREIFEFLDEKKKSGEKTGNGESEVIINIKEQDELIALIQQHTRQFAKRQRTWFRSLPECRVVDCRLKD